MEKVISCRLETDEITFINNYSKLNSSSKGKVFRELVENGRKMLGLTLYKEGKTSIGKASKISGITVSEFMDLMKEFNVKNSMTIDDFEESLENLGKLKK